MPASDSPTSVRNLSVNNESDGYRLSAINQKVETWNFHALGGTVGLEESQRKAIGWGQIFEDSEGGGLVPLTEKAANMNRSDAFSADFP